jgi:phosphomethylpyrimidine synthase
MALTQLTSALQGQVTAEVRDVSRSEAVVPETLVAAVTEGRVVVPANRRHTSLRAVGIGEGLRTKVNANLGTSPERGTVDGELAKLRTALDAGAHTIMDLSTGGNLDLVRRAIVANSPAPVGTVPIYQAAIEAGSPERMDADAFLQVFERHARDGVDFATVHAGVTREGMALVRSRLMGVVSRGGSFLVRWMDAHDRESFLYERFDDILAIAREHDVTISLGDGLRPGCIADATDEAQLHELRVLGDLAARCRGAGVQVMIEGPGHVPLQQIERNVRLAKESSGGAPFYVLGPLPTDIAPGHDHLVSAIGGAVAGSAGADFLCYVTPKEHIGLPDEDDVREGVVAALIAAHIADVAKGIAGAADRDAEMSRSRAERDWRGMLERAIDPATFARFIAAEKQDDRCSMCGEFCAVKIYRETLQCPAGAGSVAPGRPEEGSR